MSDQGSPSGALVALPASDNLNTEWQPILHAPNQVVLYNQRSHALSIAHNRTSRAEVAHHDSCPYCKQDLPLDFLPDEDGRSETEDDYIDHDPAYYNRASDYFQLLEIANETSQPPSYVIQSVEGGSISGNIGLEDSIGVEADSGSGRGRKRSGTFSATSMAEGYFKTFFQEEYKLGMGANGSVYLCQHVLDGNPLGQFAVKKIAVGESHSYLLKILREVRLLERLHHPNIITYHHAWLETCQFSSFGPKVPTLHVLMQWAEGGSLDDFIDIRLGRKANHMPINPFAPFVPSPSPSLSADPDLTPTPSPAFPSANGSKLAPSTASFSHDTSHMHASSNIHSRSARIRAFRAYQRASPSEKERMRSEMEGLTASTRKGAGIGAGSRVWTPVHLLSAEEVKSLFSDVAEGLTFLHDKSILHLDLKPGNVLLTWDEGRLIPRAMLSDFGTSRDMINTSRVARSGNTGTLEYTSPESLPSPETGLLQQIDSKSDMWSLGMILYKLLFFKLPYRYAAEGDLDSMAGGAHGASKIQEGDTLRALEREVLEYPGFKATPALVNAFEARRLPRAFLVLLESLLHKSPSARPSVERVSIAIREGKLDPLKEEPSTTSASSLIPLSLTRIRSRPDLAPTDTNNSAKENEFDISKERTHLLGLPSPPIPEPENDAHSRGWRWRVTRAVRKTKIELRKVRAGLGASGRRRRVLIRLGRSCLLVVKVLTMPSLCNSRINSDQLLSHGTRPRLGLAAILLGAAIADTVFEPGDDWAGILFSTGLALVHFGVVKLARVGWFGVGCL